jgi:hypothetical protein
LNRRLYRLLKLILCHDSRLPAKLLGALIENFIVPLRGGAQESARFVSTWIASCPLDGY